jgi:capsular polysaccharide biosynthesis protein
MELSAIARTLRARWKATALVCVLAVLVAAVARLSSHNVSTGAATIQILVDSPSSELANLNQDPAPLISRASVFAQVMTSDTVVKDIAAAAGLPADQITAQGPYSGSGQVLNSITPAEARSSQLVAESAPYRLTFLAQQNEPVITATVQAPTELAAARLAGAVFTGVQNYVAAAQQQGHTPSEHRVTLRELGGAQSATVNGGSRTTIAIAAFLGVLIVGIAVIVGVEGLRRRDRELARIEHDLDAALEVVTSDPRLRRSAASSGERHA